MDSSLLDIPKEKDVPVLKKANITEDNGGELSYSLSNSTTWVGKTNGKCKYSTSSRVPQEKGKLQEELQECPGKFVHTCPDTRGDSQRKHTSTQPIQEEKGAFRSMFKESNFQMKSKKACKDALETVQLKVTNFPISSKAISSTGHQHHLTETKSRHQPRALTDKCAASENLGLSVRGGKRATGSMLEYFLALPPLWKFGLASGRMESTGHGLPAPREKAFVILYCIRHKRNTGVCTKCLQALQDRATSQCSIPGLNLQTGIGTSHTTRSLSFIQHFISLTMYGQITPNEMRQKASKTPAGEETEMRMRSCSSLKPVKVPIEMNCPKKESLDLRQRVNQSMIFPIGQAVLARSPICTEILNTTTAAFGHISVETELEQISLPPAGAPPAGTCTMHRKLVNNLSHIAVEYASLFDYYYRSKLKVSYQE
ncbi:hypothetical protein Anapl_00161 [Anas platyrhynchos]|uniref:Uncharacterized protein n=1 Tax=Anas platyrhynchos TaxID=8839 RepID=R0LUT1_ANAPL|nr:hypothetical protein Anapl_00161 [Anas platyrhynchos]